MGLEHPWLVRQRHFERREECNTRETKHFRPRRPCIRGARILHYQESEKMASFRAPPPSPSSAAVGLGQEGAKGRAGAELNCPGWFPPQPCLLQQPQDLHTSPLTETAHGQGLS